VKIAIIGSRGIPARYGGFETFAQELAPRLVGLGHDVTVYCRAGYTGTQPSFEGVSLIHTPYLKVQALETPSHELTSILDSFGRGFDLYYFLGTRSSPLYYLVRAMGKPVVVHTDGIEWKRAKWGRAGRAWLRTAERMAARLPGACLVTDAEAMRAYYLSAFGKDSTFIPYGAPVVEQSHSAPLRRWNLEPDDYHLVVGRMEPENNITTIIEAYRDSGSSRKLIIVGDTHYETAYIRRVRSLAATVPGIELIGAVYGADLVALRSHAFSYIHGHEVGGTNPSLLEAMGCGNVIFALDTEFNREALADTGLYWSTAESLARLIAEVESGAVGVSELGAEAQRRVGVLYTWSDVAERHDILFRSRV